MLESCSKSALRKVLRERLAGMSEEDRRLKSQLACSLLIRSPEFRAARVVMLYLSMSGEVDTAPLALRAWHEGKTIVVPKVNWGQRRMLPIEISSLSNVAVTRPGLREPVDGCPIPVDMIDLVVVPGLGFSNEGHRIGRGMGFYDRFLSQNAFMGLSCGLAFSDQIVETIPVLDHDVPLSMLVSDQGIRRFASNLIGT